MSDKADYWAEYFKRPSLDKDTIEFNEQLDEEIQAMLDDSEQLDEEIQRILDDSELFDKETIEFNEWLDKEIQKMLFNTESEDNEHEVTDAFLVAESINDLKRVAALLKENDDQGK